MEGFIVGTIDDITFYKMGGLYYARMKTSLTGKKFWRHRSFAGSRRSCKRFGRGNHLASVVYNEIVEEKREYALYCRMKRVAIAMIKAGNSEEEVMDGLRKMKPVETIKRKEIKRTGMRSFLRYNILGSRKTRLRVKVRKETNSRLENWYLPLDYPDKIVLSIDSS